MRSEETKISPLWAKNRAEPPRYEVINQIRELFEVPRFGVAVHAAKSHILGAITPESWNKNEQLFFAKQFLELLNKILHPTLDKEKKITIGQIESCKDVILQHVVQNNFPTLKKTLSETFYQSENPLAQQYALAFHIVQSSPQPIEQSNNIFAWAGQVKAEQIKASTQEIVSFKGVQQAVRIIQQLTLEDSKWFPYHIDEKSRTLLLRNVQQFCQNYFETLWNGSDFFDTEYQAKLFMSVDALTGNLKGGTVGDKLEFLIGKNETTYQIYLDFIYLTLAHSDAFLCEVNELPILEHKYLEEYLGCRQGNATPLISVVSSPRIARRYIHYTNHEKGTGRINTDNAETLIDFLRTSLRRNVLLSQINELCAENTARFNEQRAWEEE